MKTRTLHFSSSCLEPIVILSLDLKLSAFHSKHIQFAISYSTPLTLLLTNVVSSPLLQRPARPWTSSLKVISTSLSINSAWPWLELPLMVKEWQAPTCRGQLTGATITAEMWWPNFRAHGHPLTMENGPRNRKPWHDVTTVRFSQSQGLGGR